MGIGTKYVLLAVALALAVTSEARSAPVETLVFSWPNELRTSAAAKPEHLERGPSAAFPELTGMWVHDNRASAFLRLSASGEVLARVPSPGFVQSFVFLPDGAIASLDQSRRRVVVQEPDGSERHDVPLPAGLTKARRLVVVNGVLLLQTAQQESFVVPLDLPDSSPVTEASYRRRALRRWFLSRREGLRFPGAGATAAAVTVAEGRATLLLYDPKTGPSVGEATPRRVSLAAVSDLLAAEIVGAAKEGWWLRLTTGAPAGALDHVARVGHDGQIQWRAPLPDASDYSWADRLWPTSRMSGGETLPEGVVHLRPDALGVERRLWRRP